jgi:bifunctional ADP-heptose synthase (sugar kinase/adenylyltransferase)
MQVMKGMSLMQVIQEASTNGNQESNKNQKTKTKALIISENQKVIVFGLETIH